MPIPRLGLVAANQHPRPGRKPDRNTPGCQPGIEVNALSVRQNRVIILPGKRKQDKTTREYMVMAPAFSLKNDPNAPNMLE